MFCPWGLLFFVFKTNPIAFSAAIRHWLYWLRNIGLRPNISLQGPWIANLCSVLVQYNYCVTYFALRAHAPTPWFAFSSRHPNHLVVDSELDGRSRWNSGFLVSTTWLNVCNIKEKKQFGDSCVVLHLKPSSLNHCKPVLKTVSGFVPKGNTLKVLPHI